VRLAVCRCFGAARGSRLERRGNGRMGHPRPATTHARHGC
jgi:hypothetical protein